MTFNVTCLMVAVSARLWKLTMGRPGDYLATVKGNTVIYRHNYGSCDSAVVIPKGKTNKRHFLHSGHAYGILYSEHRF